MHYFTLVVNAGRSGSTFLHALLNSNYAKECYVAHEDIPVQHAQPRLYNRAYNSSDLKKILDNRKTRSYLEAWQKELETRHVIETGWTSCHLCPVLHHFFGEQFRYVILHRDPISFAFSRASMGNYHYNSFNGTTHEVSPFDERSIAPQKKEEWTSMNHFEKCMYWWWVVYLEAFEFREKFPLVPSLELKSKDIFSFARTDELLAFLKLDPNKLTKRDVPRNELPQFMKETFPIDEEWKNFSRHKDILTFASELGYQFNESEILKLSQKYKLPNSIGAKLRNATNYWKIKKRFTQPIKKLLSID